MSMLVLDARMLETLEVFCDRNTLQERIDLLDDIMADMARDIEDFKPSERRNYPDEATYLRVRKNYADMRERMRKTADMRNELEDMRRAQL